MGEGKPKKDEPEEGADIEGAKESYENKIQNCSPIAQPMAPKKLTRKIYKCIKKASKHKTYLRNGLKDVQKHLRKGEKGILIFAGDVFPIEIMCHLPVVCEDKEIPYVYVPTKQDIGTAMGVKRGSLMVLIKEHEDYKDEFEAVKVAIKTLSSPL
ncbi:H/ACA ribonucleoprotein complex subunit 2-like protein [Diachasma alloeum]|uniref:H/ACA ribonucleoprotein complex subunit 2-like protein n=1 Tax=Diachasma alloeum TaxID=454923 RepID=UPI0007384DD1|nr:H/ACA ribonucleoprotein complex subunit 2-like protein [Diachasma alloeum]